MGLRFTRVRGLKKNLINASIIFACHNLKKMALWKSKKDQNITKISKNIKLWFNYVKLFKNKSKYLFKIPTLSTN